MPRYKQLLVLGIIIGLSACASPAHKNTPFWQTQIKYIPVEIQTPDSYLVDGFYMSGVALAQFLSARTEQGLYTPIKITNKFDLNVLKKPNYYEMAVVANIAEQAKVDAYYLEYLLFDHLASSDALLALNIRPLPEAEADFEDEG